MLFVMGIDRKFNGYIQEYGNKERKVIVFYEFLNKYVILFFSVINLVSIFGRKKKLHIYVFFVYMNAK